MRIESFRQFEAWNMDILHAERTVARFAVEMNMTIMMITFSFLLTQFVVQYPPAILEGMNGIMLQKERQRAEDARLIHRHHLLLQILQTQRILLIHQSFHHQYAVGGGLDALRLQLMDNLFCFHLFFF